MTFVAAQVMSRSSSSGGAILASTFAGSALLGAFYLIVVALTAFGLKPDKRTTWQRITDASRASSQQWQKDSIFFGYVQSDNSPILIE